MICLRKDGDCHLLRRENGVALHTPQERRELCTQRGYSLGELLSSTHWRTKEWVESRGACGRRQVACNGAMSVWKKTGRLF